MSRLTVKTDGKAGMALTFDLDVSFPDMDELKKFQKIMFRLFEYEEIGIVEELQELKQKLADGRLVEVVRCGECKHHTAEKCLNDTIYCYKHQTYFSNDNYCSSGERKG